jgi:L-fucose mutarotase/ribose pyranase (RbsD/FucU family)
MARCVARRQRVVDQLAAKQAETVVRGWLCTQPIILAGVDLPAATAAICSILPLDRFVECPAQYMYPSPGSEVPRAPKLPTRPIYCSVAYSLGSLQPDGCSCSAGLAVDFDCQQITALGVEVHNAIKVAVHSFGGQEVAIEPLERFEFYDASRERTTVPLSFVPHNRSLGM